MLTVSNGVPANLIVPPAMLSTAPSVDIPAMGGTSDDLVDVETGAISDNQVTLSPELDILQIQIGNDIYVLAESPDSVALPNNTIVDGSGTVVSVPSPGTFWYDWDTGIVTLPTGLPSGAIAVAKTQATITKTDLISTIPVPLREARGAVTIQYSLFNPPSISSVTFVDRRANKNALLSQFNAITPVTIDGHKYYPTQKSLVESPTENKVAIAVGYESQFRSNAARTPMDRPVKIRDMIGSGRSGNKAYATYTTTELAARARAGYSGRSFTIRVPKDIDSNATTTLRGDLSAERLMVERCFLRLDKNRIEVDRWTGVATHTIALSDLKDGDKLIPPINYNGGGTRVNGVPLLVELRGAEIKLDTTGQQGQPGDREETRISGDENPESPPAEDMGWYFVAFDANKLRSMNMVFDNGGPTKKKITTRLLNGQTISEKEEHYGFVYTSTDVYGYRLIERNGKTQAQIYFTGGSPDNLWQKFKTVNTVYEFDRDGYVTGINRTVTQLTRIAKESDQLEEITGVARYLAMDEDGISSVKKDYEARNHFINGNGLYSFTITSIPSWIPRTANLDSATDADLRFTVSRSSNQLIQASVEQRQLTNLSSVYDDVERPDNEDDPNWVEPKFIAKRTILENGTEIIEDPRRTQQESPPPIVFGKESNLIETIEVLSPKEPEKFKVRTSITNKEGERLQESATEVSNQVNDGRVPIAERLTRYGQSPIEPEDEDDPEEKYLVTTTGLLSIDTVTQTLSFPGAYTLNDARRALDVWLLIKNLDAATTTLTLNHERSNMRVGDRVVYNGKKWRIKGITNNKEIDATGIPRQTNFTVELGFDFGNIPFTIRTVRRSPSSSGARSGSFSLG